LTPIRAPGAAALLGVSEPALLRGSIIPCQEGIDMGRPKHTLPPVHKTDAQRPRWFFRAQVDALCRVYRIDAAKELGQ
jgi:hypothetical protein